MLIAVISPEPSIIGLMNEIIANIINIIINASTNPYIIPPALSNCFIIGRSVINEDSALTNINAILAIINRPIATPTFTAVVDICCATWFTTVCFVSFTATSIDSFI